LALDVQAGLESWWAPALAFAAGIVSFASPCVFPLVPGYLSFVAGGETKDERRPIVPLLLFVGGFATVFTVLGAVLPLVYSSLPDNWKDVALRVSGLVIIGFGIVMIVYALRLRVPGLYAEKRPFLERVRPGKTGAFALGMAFGVGWTPCLGPVLGVILTVAANSGGALRGGLLLLVYSAGLGVPFVLIGLGIRKLMDRLDWVGRNYHWITGIAGAVMIVIGFLMVTGLWMNLLNPILQRIQTFETPL
jgi:cytochrome c-type biogenesis protein